MTRGHRRGPSKYQPLAGYLAALTLDQVRLRFPEIEAILGAPLPAAAAYQGGFWSNHAPGVLRVQPWVRAGWRVVRTDLHSAPPAVHFARVERGSAA